MENQNTNTPNPEPKATIKDNKLSRKKLLLGSGIAALVLVTGIVTFTSGNGGLFKGSLQEGLRSVAEIAEVRGPGLTLLSGNDYEFNLGANSEKKISLKIYDRSIKTGDTFSADLTDQSVKFKLPDEETQQTVKPGDPVESSIKKVLDTPTVKTRLQFDPSPVVNPTIEAQKLAPMDAKEFGKTYLLAQDTEAVFIDTTQKTPSPYLSGLARQIDDSANACSVTATAGLLTVNCPQEVSVGNYTLLISKSDKSVYKTLNIKVVDKPVTTATQSPSQPDFQITPKFIDPTSVELSSDIQLGQGEKYYASCVSKRSGVPSRESKTSSATVTVSNLQSAEEYDCSMKVQDASQKVTHLSNTITITTASLILKLTTISVDKSVFLATYTGSIKPTSEYEYSIICKNTQDSNDTVSNKDIKSELDLGDELSPGQKYSCQATLTDNNDMTPQEIAKSNVLEATVPSANTSFLISQGNVTSSSIELKEDSGSDKTGRDSYRAICIPRSGLPSSTSVEVNYPVTVKNLQPAESYNCSMSVINDAGAVLKTSNTLSIRTLAQAASQGDTQIGNNNQNPSTKTPEQIAAEKEAAAKTAAEKAAAAKLAAEKEAAAKTAAEKAAAAKLAAEKEAAAKAAAEKAAAEKAAKAAADKLAAQQAAIDKATAQAKSDLAAKQAELAALKSQIASYSNNGSTIPAEVVQALIDLQKQVNDLKNKATTSTTTVISSGSSTTSGTTTTTSTSTNTCDKNDTNFQKICEKGVITEYRPKDYIKRYEEALIFSRFAQKGLSASITGTDKSLSFKDESSFAREEWKTELYNSLKSFGILKGYSDGRLQPGNNITYVEHYRALYNLYITLGKTEAIGTDKLQDAIKLLQKSDAGFVLNEENQWYVIGLQFAINKHLTIVPVKDLFTLATREQVTRNMVELM